MICMGRVCGLPVTIGSCTCPPAKARRPRQFGLLTRDSEWYIDIVNSQVRSVVITVVIVERL